MLIDGYKLSKLEDGLAVIFDNEDDMLQGISSDLIKIFKPVLQNDWIYDIHPPDDEETKKYCHRYRMTIADGQYIKYENEEWTYKYEVQCEVLWLYTNGHWNADDTINKIKITIHRGTCDFISDIIDLKIDKVKLN